MKIDIFLQQGIVTFDKKSVNFAVPLNIYILPIVHLTLQTSLHAWTTCMLQQMTKTATHREFHMCYKERSMHSVYHKELHIY